LQPLEDGQLIDQISSINGLQANSALAKTLESLSETLSGQGLAQSLGAASSLIGKSVSGTLGEQTITGVVDRAVVEEGEVFLMVGDSKLPLNSITEVQ
jgi:flagellar hook assembly protein FlgD